MDILKLAKKYNDEIVEIRRHCHQYPELSFEERETTKYIVDKLKSFGIDEKDIETFDWANGCIATIHGKGPGKTVMLRADIDALPITEKTDLPFASQNKGVMHACGHDNHIAMLMGGAKILSEIKGEFPGTVKLLFQQAEESAHGAKDYVAHGCLNGVDAIFGTHIWGTLPAGKVSVQGGVRMAAFDNFKITVKGASAHCSAPHAGNDAIVAAANVVMNVQGVVSRYNNPIRPLVITIGTMNGGKRFNIIPDLVELTGTVRTLSDESRQIVRDKMPKVVAAAAETYGCVGEVEFIPYLNILDNKHENLNKIGEKAAKAAFGEDGLIDMAPIMGSEDFTLFMDEVPGLFGFVGTKNEDKGIVYTNHNDKFTSDEDVLHKGAALYAQFAYDYLTTDGGVK